MRAGDIIWNPLTGEKALLVESAEESDGERIVVEFAVEQGGFVPGGDPGPGTAGGIPAPRRFGSASASNRRWASRRRS